MQITVRTLIDFVTALRSTNRANDFLPGRWKSASDLNLRRCQPEVETWVNLPKKVQQQFAEELVEVNIHRVSMDFLPERLPNFADADILELLSPMLSDYQKHQRTPSNSQLAEMIEESESDTDEEE